TTTWTSADGYHAAITKSTPDGGYSENIDTQVNGSVVDATTYRKADGSTASQKTVTTSANGLSTSTVWSANDQTLSSI
ncbi:hypothetical protein ACO1NJ_14900, partial [Staphylococcus aureus]